VVGVGKVVEEVLAVSFHLETIQMFLMYTILEIVVVVQVLV
jgi:hypothetical protein